MLKPGQLRIRVFLATPDNQCFARVMALMTPLDVQDCHCTSVLSVKLPPELPATAEAVGYQLRFGFDTFRMVKVEGEELICERVGDPPAPITVNPTVRLEPSPNMIRPEGI